MPPLAQVDPTAQTVFIGLNWELPATTPQVEIDASLFCSMRPAWCAMTGIIGCSHCVGLGTAALPEANNDKVCVMPKEKGEKRMILTDNETKVDLLNNEAIATTIIGLLGAGSLIIR